MINSLFLTYGESMMPYAVNNDNVTTLLLMLFPEMKKYYGPNIKLSAEA
jgi:hypothetical protein